MEKMNNKQKTKLSLVLLTFILVCSFASTFPKTSASIELLSYNVGTPAGYSQMNAVFPYYGNKESATCAIFVPSASGYVLTSTIWLFRVGTVDGYVGAAIIESANNGSSAPKNPLNILETSTTYFAISSISATENLAYTFAFSGDLYLNSSLQYGIMVFVENSTTIDSTHRVDAVVLTNTALPASWRYNSGGWIVTGSNLDMCYNIVGETTAPTPTPVPATSTPTPTPDMSYGIWSTIAPYSTMLLPLIIILVVAIICGKFGGVWGFFAGLNVSCILIYVIMGTAYFPLWGIILLAVVDAMLLFGKVSGRI